MKKYLFVVSLTPMVSCNNELDTITNVDSENNQSSLQDNTSYSEENRAMRPTIIGKQKQNPYSVENMQRALDTLMAYANAVGDEEMQNSTGIRPKSLQSVRVSTTDLYVRFLPKDSAGFSALVRDTTLELFDRPLDHDVVQAGDYYHDPSLPDSSYTWYYTTVKPGYEPPQGVDYEILDELFIMENSEGYSEEILSDQVVTAKALSAKPQTVIDNDLRNALLATSFILTGNEKELAVEYQNTSSLKKSVATPCNTITQCKKRCLWRLCIEFCDTWYNPEGYIRVNTPNGDIPLKGIRVRVSRWFTYCYTYTNSVGYYRISYSFDKLLLLNNNASYDIFFEGRRGSNSWTFSTTLFGAVCLWTSSYGAGAHGPGGFSLTFGMGNDFWGQAVLHNAIYDYIGYAGSDGINLPPTTLDIACAVDDSLASSAPLLKNHTDIPANVIAVVSMFGVLLLPFVPDLLLRYTKIIDKYNKMIATCWHELTHASQLQRMKSEKGYRWASDYWSVIVYQEAYNQLFRGGNTYGNKGDDNWQVIALAEGWAYYREWDLARRKLNWNSFTDTIGDYYVLHELELSFPRNYAKMFDALKTIGCSTISMEKAVGSSYSISGFRNYLISRHPYLSSQITTIVQPYE